jgi:hypothetical protein
MSLDLNLPIASQDLCGPAQAFAEQKNALVDYAKADFKAPMAISAAIARVTNVVLSTTVYLPAATSALRTDSVDPIVTSEVFTGEKKFESEPATEPNRYWR